MLLLHSYRGGNSLAREDIVNGNLRLVLSVIQKFMNRGENADDLFQVGCIGLIKAIDNFDTNQPVRFATYAVPMIIGEVRRYLRDNSAIRVSRSVRDTAYKVMQAREELMKSSLREPEPDEIAKILNISRADVLSAMDAMQEPISLYEPIFTEGDDSLCGMDQIGDPNSSSDSWIEKIAMSEAIEKLTDREKLILSMRFYDGKTQTQVAEQIGISQAQVSRLEKNAIMSIKKCL